MPTTSLTTSRARLISRLILGCTDCELHLHCTAPVPPSYPPAHLNPELLVVGEAPGSQEDQIGEPFVGPAGGLLTRWLRAEMNLSRKQVLITNAVACRPTEANAGKKNRAPSKNEMYACRDHLARVVDWYVEMGGRWVMLMGSTALKAFLGPDARITSWAGRPFVLTHPKRLINVMATYHPAAALRDDRHIATIKRHMGFYARLRKGTEPWPQMCFCRDEAVCYDGMGVGWCEKHRGFRRDERMVVRVRPAQGRLTIGTPYDEMATVGGSLRRAAYRVP